MKNPYILITILILASVVAAIFGLGAPTADKRNLLITVSILIAIAAIVVGVFATTRSKK